MDERLQVLPKPSGCPFAMPMAPDTTGAAFYCRLPSGRVRVPTPEERARFCATGRYDLCPTLRRHVRDN
jgi:hypothetical protein